MWFLKMHIITFISNVFLHPYNSKVLLRLDVSERVTRPGTKARFITKLVISELEVSAGHLVHWAHWHSQCPCPFEYSMDSVGWCEGMGSPRDSRACKCDWHLWIPSGWSGRGRVLGSHLFLAFLRNRVVRAAVRGRWIGISYFEVPVFSRSC